MGTRPSAVWAEQCAAAGIPHAAIPMRSEVDLASAVALARLIRARRIDIVHCQKGQARTLALLAGLLVKIPVLILNRGVSFPLDRWNRLGYTNRARHRHRGRLRVDQARPRRRRRARRTRSR